MNAEILERRFAEIGARVRVLDPSPPPPVRFARLSPRSTSNVRRLNEQGRTIRLNVLRDGHGEYFTVAAGPDARVEVLEVRKDDRHLLLFTEQDGVKSKFLCGHDERHWFVAAIPDADTGVTTVRQAKDALQPEPVRRVARRVKPKDRHRRRNAAFMRQGEWFFLPEPDLEVNDALVLRNEPLSRGSGTSHNLEYAYRIGGSQVYVGPGGAIVSADEWAQMDVKSRKSFPTARIMDPTLYAKGRVSHPDHATIVLDCWHRVEMNTERGARAMRHVAFID